MAPGNPTTVPEKQASNHSLAGRQSVSWRDKAPLLHIIWNPTIPANERPEHIDNKLFIPLAKFLSGDRFDPRHLEELINLIGIPAHFMNGMLGTMEQAIAASRGFILEAYVKWTLARFANSIPPHTFAFAHQHNETLNGLCAEIRAWGSAHFFNKTEKGTTTNEIDCLGEFFSDGRLDPVIFEITHREKKTFSYYRISDRVKKKVHLVMRLYEGYEPYLCYVRSSSDMDKVGLYSNPGQNRTLIIPAREELEEIAEKIRKRGPDSNHICPLSSP